MSPALDLLFISGRKKIQDAVGEIFVSLSLHAPRGMAN